MTTVERLRGFFWELRAIEAKYGFQVDGCGCCGSPAIASTDKKENVWIPVRETGNPYDDFVLKEIERLAEKAKVESLPPAEVE